MEEASDTFDVIVASEVVEHVADVEMFIRCCSKVLKVSWKKAKKRMLNHLHCKIKLLIIRNVLHWFPFFFYLLCAKECNFMQPLLIQIIQIENKHNLYNIALFPAEEMNQTINGFWVQICYVYLKT